MQRVTITLDDALMDELDAIIAARGMPLDASGFEYGIGFMLATSVLHATGIFIGMLIGLSTRVLGNNLYRLAGGLASVAGLALLLGYA
jgi:urease accessory protein